MSFINLIRIENVHLPESWFGQKRYLRHLCEAIDCICRLDPSRNRMASSFSDRESFEGYHRECTLMLERVRDIFAKIIGLDGQSLHSTIKIIPKSHDPAQFGSWEVWTKVRTQEDHSRFEIGPESCKTIGQNSALAALAGCNDTKENYWKYYYPCFCCNDLVKYGHRFADNRINPVDFYRSTLVFPFRHEETKQGRRQIRVKGYLTFDSRNRKVFRKVPCNFEHKDDFAKYKDKLYKSPVYQAGAIISNVLVRTLIL